MNEYEYRIPLFGPHYSNSRIIRIIRDNTASVLLELLTELKMNYQHLMFHCSTPNLPLTRDRSMSKKLAVAPNLLFYFRNKLVCKKNLNMNILGLHHVVHHLDLGHIHLTPALPDPPDPQHHHLQEAQGAQGGR